MSKSKQKSSATIAVNKRARHDFFIHDKFEAGLALSGWEVKSIRSGKVNLAESYIHLKDGEAWLVNCHISALKSASTHVLAEPTRPRKLLLHNKELARLFGAVSKEGYTIVALSMYWKRQFVKLEIATAKGKKLHDKRATAKDKEWARSKERILKNQR